MSTDLFLSKAPAIILAISTSGSWCSVATLRDAGATLDALEEQVDHAHSSRALPLIDSLLDSTGLGLRDLSGVAFDAGPGGFTGLRIACSLAQGLGFGLGIPVLAVGSLDAIALEVLEGISHPGVGPSTVIVAIDARMSECYVAAFAGIPSRDDGWRLDPVEPARICRRDDMGPWLKAVATRCAGNGVTVAGDAFERFPALADAARELGAMIHTACRPRAGAVARLAGSVTRRGNWCAPAQARPLYVRDKVALDVGEQRELRRRNAAERL